MANEWSKAAFVVSLIALGVVSYTHVQVRAHLGAAEQHTAIALDAREKELVAWLAPRVQSIVVEFDVPGVPAEPTTVEEALAPLFEIAGAINTTVGG